MVGRSPSSWRLGRRYEDPLPRASVARPRSSATRRRPCSAGDARVVDRNKPGLSCRLRKWSPPNGTLQRGLQLQPRCGRVAVLAAIAALDALCCRLLGERSRRPGPPRCGRSLSRRCDSERETRRCASRRSRDLADALATALDLKDELHYGAALVGRQQVKKLLRVPPGKLVDAANRRLSASFRLPSDRDESWEVSPELIRVCDPKAGRIAQ